MSPVVKVTAQTLRMNCGTFGGGPCKAPFDTWISEPWCGNLRCIVVFCNSPTNLRKPQGSADTYVIYKAPKVCIGPVTTRSVGAPSPVESPNPPGPMAPELIPRIRSLGRSYQPFELRLKWLLLQFQVSF